MSYGSKFSARTKLSLGVLALAMACASHATGVQVGGGATLPSAGYIGSNAASTGIFQFYTAGTGSNGFNSGSLFAVISGLTSNPGLSYCLTGSGAGKDILASGTIGTVDYGVQFACPKNTAGTQSGFNAGLTGVGRGDLTQPNFVAADSPLSATDITNYQTGHGSTSDWPTEFPVIAGSIAISLNLVDSTGAQVTSSEVNFSDAQVCSIFSNQVTAWNASSLASAFSLPAGHSIPATPIKVAYRSDGSGTSFSFSNHLTDVCGTIAGKTFQASQNFVGAAPAVTSGFFTSAPSNWTGVSGNAAVAAAIDGAGDNGTVGYVEEANILAAGSPTTLQAADVNGLSPVTNFGSALTLTSADYLVNNVINPTNASNGQPQTEAITSPPSTSCIVLVKPTLYATSGTKGGLLSSTTYPIVAVSYFLGNAQGNESTDLANTQTIVDAPYNSTITGSVTTVGSGKGLAFLTLGSGAFSSTAPGACLH